MQLNGIHLDLTKWKSLTDCLEQEQIQLTQQIYRYLNPASSTNQLFPLNQNSINLNSPIQVKQALNQIGIKVNSTNSAELIPLAPKNPVIRLLLDYRSLTSRINTFAYGLTEHIHPVTGRVHGNWWQMGARSGRFSCREPNLTNIPNDSATRSCFTAEAGNLIIKADYSQIELRLMARLSGDLRMRRAYLNNEDLHRLTAAYLFAKSTTKITPEERKLGKIVNFGLIYGMGVSKFCLTTAKNYGIYLSRKEAREFRVKFFQLYPGIARYHAAIRRQWQQGARSSYTLDGRRRLWKGKNPPTLNELLNHPVQGTSATITKRAIALFDEWVNKHRLTAMIIAVIHDEIVVECNSSEVVKTAKLLQQCMVSAARPLLAPIPVEVDVQVGQSWGG